MASRFGFLDKNMMAAVYILVFPLAILAGYGGLWLCVRLSALHFHVVLRAVSHGIVSTKAAAKVIERIWRDSTVSISLLLLVFNFVKLFIMRSYQKGYKSG